MPPVTTWPCEDVRLTLDALLPGCRVQAVAEIDSTNAELMRRAHAGDLAPTLLVAAHQSAGRGRMGRTWRDCRAANGTPGSLMFSLGLPLAPNDWSGLSLAVGLSLADSLHPEVALKWPNDLWWRDRKLAGVLVETLNWGGSAGATQRHVVVGVGINVADLAADGLSTAPAALTELLPDITAAGALLRVAAPLVLALQRFEQYGFAPLQVHFNARDALSQVAVTLSDGTQGVAQGVDPHGALRVLTPAGVQRITSAEVSVRTLRAPARPTA